MIAADAESLGAHFEMMGSSWERMGSTPSLAPHAYCIRGRFGNSESPSWMKRGLLRLLLACCVGCLAVAAQAAPPTPIEIAPEAEQVPVWQGLHIVAPADRQLAPDQAAELAAGSGAISVDSPERVLGRGTLP